jgi:hypothetical protein
VSSSQSSAAPSTEARRVALRGDTMKFKTLIASAAFMAIGTVVAGAADMPVNAPPPPLPRYSVGPDSTSAATLAVPGPTTAGRTRSC